MTKAIGYEFKIGELAVYPSHGVGVISTIEKRKGSGNNQLFYILKILDSDATIMIPVSNAFSVGMRKVMKKTMVPKIYSVLKQRKGISFDNQTWNRRYRDYAEKIKTGCVIEVAKVLRDLNVLKVDKDLSFGERRMLDTAKSLLVKEISIAKRIKEDKIEEELDRAMRG